MPRPPRLDVTGMPYHVIARGNNKQTVFTNDRQRRRYLTWLRESCEHYGVAIHAWVLMSNHVHFLMTPHKAYAISNVMRHLGSRYVPFFNRETERTGGLWEGRFRSSLVDTDKYFLACQRYIELNPVDARMVESPEDYCWSSYQFNALGIHDPLVTPHDTYLSLASTDARRRQIYQTLVAAGVDDRTRQLIRERTRRNRCIGDKQFTAKMRAKAGHHG